MKTRLVHILFFCLLMQSCRDSILVEITPSPEQVVVVSEISPDDKIELDLSVTSSLFSGERPSRPEDAAIFLSGTDLPSEATAFIYSSQIGKYQFRNKDFRPSSGESYTLSVNIPGTDFVQMYATTTVPKPVTLEKAIPSNEKEISAINGLNDVVFDLDLFLNQAEINNTYLHIVPKRVKSEFKIDAEGEVRVTFFAETEPLQVLQIMGDHNAVNELNHKNGVFVDYAKLSENKVKLRLSTSTLLDPNKDILQNIEVTVYTLSKDLYEYHQNLHKQLINSSSSFTSPTTTFTNIENGLGVFGGMSSSSSLIKL